MGHLSKGPYERGKLAKNLLRLDFGFMPSGYLFRCTLRKTAGNSAKCKTLGSGKMIQV
jgi:hypothetical protein